MNLYRGLETVPPLPGCVLTLGMFDGVHLGHQQLIKRVVDEAVAANVHAAVVTFHPHPDVLLGRSGGRELTSLAEKARLISELGADSMTIVPFTRETMATPAGDFVQQLMSRMHMCSMWVGEDFALGKGRQGDSAFLQTQGASLGFVVHVLPHLFVEGERISSTRIRQALGAGDSRLAQRMIGR